MEDAIIEFPDLFATWLANRGLNDVLSLEGETEGFHVYNYMKEPVVRRDASWTAAYHGTWWCATWLLLEAGVLLESDSPSMGHDFWAPGVYCSTRMETALSYARPQNVFHGGVYYKVVLELQVDPELMKTPQARR